MGENNNFLGFRMLEMISKLFVLAGFLILGAFIGQFFGMFASVFILELNIKSGSDPAKLQAVLMNFIQDPSSFNHGSRAFMAMQWFTSLGTFVGSAWAYNKYRLKQTLSDLSPNTHVSWHIYVWSIVALIVGMPLMEFIINLNKNIALPAGYHTLEVWMKTQELAMDKVTQTLLNFETPVDFVLGLMTIGFLAALGEELFFRGVLQNIIEKYSLNSHVAVWSTAIIFSFIHFQFLGFFPRVLLGAFFGYLYVWYRNLWIPIICHFFNNALGVVSSYLYQQKIIDTDPLSGTINSEYYMVVLSLVLVVFYVRRLYNYKL